MVETVLFLRKLEVTEVNENLHQGETSLREIQRQGNMGIYTGTLSVMHAIVMDIFPINAQIKTKAMNFSMIGVMLMKNGCVIKKT